ncbi:MAG: histidine kinase, partial [Bacteroidota bacterium]
WKSKRKIPQRLVIEILIGSILAVIQVVVINMIFSIYVDETINFNNYLFSAIVSIIINLILLTTMEFYFQIRRQYDTDLDNERLKKENLQFRYAQLKHQVNPHFLFNSLNSLSSLITIDQYRAKESIRKLSQVYRYVLEHVEKRWITLKEELEFINSYIYLLKIRFQEDLIIEIKIPEAHHQKQIAPMTLQLLIENAVKHNIIEENDPLKIEITFDDDKLMIKNQLKPKQSGYSKGIGLQNLKQEYEHQGESLQVDEAAGEFRVTVPLLKI